MHKCSLNKYWIRNILPYYTCIIVFYIFSTHTVHVIQMWSYCCIVQKGVQNLKWMCCISQIQSRNAKKKCAKHMRNCETALLNRIIVNWKGMPVCHRWATVCVKGIERWEIDAKQRYLHLHVQDFNGMWSTETKN